MDLEDGANGGEDLDQGEEDLEAVAHACEEASHPQLALDLHLALVLPRHGIERFLHRLL